MTNDKVESIASTNWT